LSRNTVGLTIVGNLTDDPELRFTPAGAAVCRFTVAVNERVPDKAKPGEFKDGPASFYRCTAWRQLAEHIGECLVKGTRVIVVGTQRQTSWKDKDDASKTHYAWEVTADAVGPDMSWARVEVRKLTRRAGEETPPDDPWATGTREPAMAGDGGW
jgi:single-strand DNA-binding protein